MDEVEPLLCTVLLVLALIGSVGAVDVWSGGAVRDFLGGKQRGK